MKHQKPYKTIDQPAEAEFRDRNSKFIGLACGANSEKEVDEILDERKSAHPKSRHIVFAFRIGPGGEIYRASDDGEPSGSSGLPVFNQIKSAELDNVLVTVVRYFGGTKLGIPGLINAYGEAARLAIENATTRWVKPVDEFLVQANYAHMGKLMDVLKDLPGLEITASDFTDGVELNIEIEKELTDETLQRILCEMAEVPYDPHRKIEIDGLEINEVGGEG